MSIARALAVLAVAAPGLSQAAPAIGGCYSDGRCWTIPEPFAPLTRAPGITDPKVLPPLRTTPYPQPPPPPAPPPLSLLEPPPPPRPPPPPVRYQVLTDPLGQTVVRGDNGVTLRGTTTDGTAVLRDGQGVTVTVQQDANGGVMIRSSDGTSARGQVSGGVTTLNNRDGTTTQCYTTGQITRCE